jgi:hypothetical protein
MELPLSMTTENNSTPPTLRIPLPPPLSHAGIEFIPSPASLYTQRLPDETVVAIGIALFDVLESRPQAHGSQSSRWGMTGSLESVQRSER